MQAQSIVMALASRNTQATARVTVLVATGDGSKTTASDGSALFYSGRSSSPGTFTFCVSGVTKAGMSYDLSANSETCDSISK